MCVHAERIGLIIIECFIICLVVKSRILDSLVVARDANVRTQSGIERHHSLTLCRTLGGDHNHTVSATGTVERRRRSILEHCHRCHVGRVKVVPTAIVWGAVNHNKRVFAGADTAETAHANRWCGSRVAAVVHHLHTGSLALQRTHHIGQLLGLDGLGLHHGSRTGKCRTLLLAESSNHHFLEHLLIAVKGNFHVLRHCHHLWFHSHVCNLDFFAGLNATQSKPSVDVGRPKCFAVLQFDCGSDDSFALRIYDYASHRAALRRCSKCKKCHGCCH